jgi:hypothetical protein
MLAPATPKPLPVPRPQLTEDPPMDILDILNAELNNLAKERIPDIPINALYDMMGEAGMRRHALEKLKDRLK